MVLIRQLDSHRVRGSSLRSISLVLPERLVLLLESLTVHHRVVGLLNGGTDEVETTRNLDSLLDLHCTV